jgi:hypothetical protein
MTVLNINFCRRCGRKIEKYLISVTSDKTVISINPPYLANFKEESPLNAGKSISGEFQTRERCRRRPGTTTQKHLWTGPRPSSSSMTSPTSPRSTHQRYQPQALLYWTKFCSPDAHTKSRSPHAGVHMQLPAMHVRVPRSVWGLRHVQCHVHAVAHGGVWKGRGRLHLQARRVQQQDPAQGHDQTRTGVRLAALHCVRRHVHRQHQRMHCHHNTAKRSEIPPRSVQIRPESCGSRWG